MPRAGDIGATAARAHCSGAVDIVRAVGRGDEKVSAALVNLGFLVYYLARMSRAGVRKRWP